MSVTLDPSVLVALALPAYLYARAVRVLRRRGYEVPAGQQTAWWGGMALLAVGLLGPLDGWADDLVVSHMAQHLLIADIAAPLLLTGIRSPVLVFLPPRPLLVSLARRHGLRRAFRIARRPLPALAIYTLVLYGWHLGFTFEGALRRPWLHVLQHASFIGASALIWWAAIEPKRRRMRGELWKIGYIIGARFPSMFLAMAFLTSRVPFYGGFYGESARGYGLSLLSDQQLAGGLMLSLDVLVMMFALGFFFWHAAQENDRAENRSAAVA